MTSLRRKATNHAFTTIAALALLLALVPLVGVTLYVLQQGAPALSWDFLTQVPKGSDDPTSGIGPALQGTLVLTLLAAAIGVPLGIAAGAWLAEHGRNKWGDAFRLLLDSMAATPSIVMGLFVFAVVVISTGHFSAMAGGLALGLMVVPVVARTTEVALRAVPDPLREAGIALGATHARTLVKVTLPAAGSGIVTGAILALARVAGETAPLLFTALYSAYWMRGFDKPIAALSTFIYQFYRDPTPALRQQAWGAAFVLFVAVFGANVLVRILTHARSRQP
ncbi:MAG: phosphate ABC transporter permease PstA [Candidatus Thermoplasmatota archaeon]